MPMGAAPGLPPGYESAEQTVTLGALLTLSHGLGVLPKMVRVRLKCVVADAGYSIGDVIDIGLSYQQQANGGGQALRCDENNIFIRFSNASYQGHNKGTGAPSNLTTTSWKIITSAFA